eukprot:UC4_evm4s1566
MAEGGRGMKVAYEVRESPVGGRGLFALSLITKGTLIWSFKDAPLRVLKESEARQELEAAEKDDVKSKQIFTLLNLWYWSEDDDGNPVLIDNTRDDGRFFNHSSNPCVALGSVLGHTQIASRRDTFALRDINAGEELLDDYNTFGDDPLWYADLLERHNVDVSYM